MLEKEMKEFLNQRMVSYVDILLKSENTEEEAKFFFKYQYEKYKIKYDNIIIGNFKGLSSVEIKDRNLKINAYDSELNIYSLLSIDLSDGYISFDSVDDKEKIITMSYHKFTNEQKEYNEIHDYLYPRYDIHMDSFIMNNMLGYKISINIFLSFLDEEPYIVDLYVPVTTDGGMDLVIDTMIELYNNILSRDFVEFFNIEDIEITNAPYEDLKGKYMIIDHHYTDHTFLCVNRDTNLQLQIEYLEYFCSKQYEINFGNSEVLFPTEASFPSDILLSDDKEKSIEMKGQLHVNNDVKDIVQELKEMYGIGIMIDRDPQVDLQLLEDDINHLKSPKIDMNNFN